MIGEIFKTETNDTSGKDEFKKIIRKFGLSEFESLVDRRNNSSNIIKDYTYSQLKRSIVNKGFPIRVQR